MKLITLNTWAGIAGKDQLLDFFKKYKDNVDIFCLQEIFNGGADDTSNTWDKDLARGIEFELHNLIKKTLHGYQHFFSSHYKDYAGMSIFSRDIFKVNEDGERFVHKFKEFLPEGNIGLHARHIQYIKITHNNKDLTIINFHGLWNGMGKNDTEDRLDQSKKILEFIETLSGEYILCGDFNLRPDTESLKMFEDHGMRNLIKEYGITSTRTSHYTKPEKFADYILITPGIEVLDFKVLPDEVSDHAALYLEIK